LLFELPQLSKLVLGDAKDLGKRIGVDGVAARGVWGEGAGKWDNEARVGNWGWGITSARAGRGRRECIVYGDDEGERRKEDVGKGPLSLL
jgi:hypothetical protein